MEKCACSTTLKRTNCMYSMNPTNLRRTSIRAVLETSANIGSKILLSMFDLTLTYLLPFFDNNMTCTWSINHGCGCHKDYYYYVY